MAAFTKGELGAEDMRKHVPLSIVKHCEEKGPMMDSVEICAGAGGQALGLELAGFQHAALVEIEPEAQRTLRLNRPHWNTLENGDVREFSGKSFRGIDLLARLGLRVSES
jgi:hypothetical protein